MANRHKMRNECFFPMMIMGIMTVMHHHDYCGTIQWMATTMIKHAKLKSPKSEGRLEGRLGQTLVVDVFQLWFHLPLLPPQKHTSIISTQIALCWPYCVLGGKISNHFHENYHDDNIWNYFRSSNNSENWIQAFPHSQCLQTVLRWNPENLHKFLLKCRSLLLALEGKCPVANIWIGTKK